MPQHRRGRGIKKQHTYKPNRNNNTMRKTCLQRKRALTAAAFMLIAQAAMTQAAMAQTAGDYTVSGTFKNSKSDGETVYIVRHDDGKAIDSTVVDGKNFVFRGKTATSELCRITVDSRSASFFVLEPGNITVPVDKDNIIRPAGTPLNSDLAKITDEQAGVS